MFLYKLIIFVPLFNYIPVTQVNSENNSDIIVINSHHADAVARVGDTSQNTSETTTATPSTTKKEIERKKKVATGSKKEKKRKPVEDFFPKAEDDVMFIPGGRNNENYRRDFYSGDDDDFLDNGADTVADLIKGKGRIETEAPPEHDILFINGKNNENTEIEKKERQSASYNERSGMEIKNVDPLDCQNLDCNRTLNSVCGKKKENNNWKYRLFYNDCYLRRVNCGFRYQESRYIKVSKNKCANVGAHYQKPQYHPPLYHPSQKIVQRNVKNDEQEDFRRSFSSRRSLSESFDGRACDHQCPLVCPDNYQPECAQSAWGQKKVFLNHCKLDYASCLKGEPWYIRPLSDCVGHSKAEVEHSRNLIGWMQRAGIVDAKGRFIKFNKGATIRLRH